MCNHVRARLDQYYLSHVKILSTKDLSKELMRRNNFQTLILATFLETYLLSAMLLRVMCSKIRLATPVALPHNKTVNMCVN